MSLWEELEQLHIDEVERLAGSKASLIANHRVEKQFGGYLKSARTQTEKQSRFAMVEEAVEGVIKEACDEYGTPTEPVREAVLNHIASLKLACGSCGCDGCGEGKHCGCKDCPSCDKAKESRISGGHADGCDCGFCQNKGKLPGSSDETEEVEEPEMEKAAGIDHEGTKCPKCSSLDIAHEFDHHASHEVQCNQCGNRFQVSKSTDKAAKWHFAEKKLPGWNERQKSDRGAVFGEDGGQYAMGDVKTIDSRDGVGDHGAVKTDHKRVPEEGLKPVPIDSKEHPHEDQSVEERWNHEYSGPYTDSGEPNTSEKPHEFVDADKPIGDTTAYPTKTFGESPRAADPVTNVALSKWHYFTP